MTPLESFIATFGEDAIDGIFKAAAFHLPVLMERGHWRTVDEKFNRALRVFETNDCVECDIHTKYFPEGFVEWFINCEKGTK
jgi:hypothetical protein